MYMWQRVASGPRSQALREGWEERLFPSVPALVFEAGSLTESLLDQTASSWAPPVLCLSQNYSYCALPCPTSYVGSRDLNLGPPTRTASTLPIEASFQFSGCIISCSSGTDVCVPLSYPRPTESDEGYGRELRIL